MSRNFEPATLAELRDVVAPILVQAIPGQLTLAKAVIAAIICDRVLGSVWLAPFYLYCPGGAPRWNAEGCRAILIRAGVKCEILVQTPERCELRVEREGHAVKTFVYTAEQAKRAGLLPGKPGSVWASQPELMLAARCWTKAGSFHADLLGAATVDDMPTDEEMQSVQTAVESVASVAPIAAEGSAVAHLLALRAGAGRVAEPVAPSVAEQVAPVVVAPVVDLAVDAIRAAAKSSGWARATSKQDLSEFGKFLEAQPQEARDNLAASLVGINQFAMVNRLNDALSAMRAVADAEPAPVAEQVAAPVDAPVANTSFDAAAEAPRVIILRAVKSLRPDADSVKVAAWLKAQTHDMCVAIVAAGLGQSEVDAVVKFASKK